MALKQWKDVLPNNKIASINKISNTLKDYYKNNPEEKKRSLKTLTCPKCGKIGVGSVMYKHHFDNCGKKQIISEEQRLKMSESHKGKFIGDKSPSYGKTLSDDTKNKITEGLKQYWNNK